MKITHKGDYALKAILDLSIHHGKGLVTIQTLAKRIDAPAKFLEQVLLELKRGGFIKSYRGKVGGYQLSRSAKEISVGDVIRFIDGPLEPIACVNSSYDKCKEIHSCVFQPIWKKVFKTTSEIVDNITFEDLVKDVKAKQNIPTYHI